MKKALAFVLLVAFMDGCRPLGPQANRAANLKKAAAAEERRQPPLRDKLKGIARKCHYQLSCYWLKGYDYIELEACRKPGSLFSSTDKCKRKSIEILEDMILELNMKGRRRVRRVASLRRWSGRASSGGESGADGSNGEDNGGGNGGSENGGNGDGNGDSENGGNGGAPPNPEPRPIPCPVSNPSSSKKLADIQFQPGGGSPQVFRYVHRNLDRQLGLFATGSSRPSQNKLLYVEFRTTRDNFRKVWLNKDEADPTLGAYYLYIEGARYSLSGGSDGDAGGVSLYKFEGGGEITGGNFDIGIGFKKVHLAYQDLDGNCHYIRP